MPQQAHLEKYFNEKEHSYLSFRPHDPYAENFTKHFLDSGPIDSHHRILEVGAGEGRFSLHLLKAGYDVTCVDLSERLRNKFFENAQRCGLAIEARRFHCMPIEDFVKEQESDSFDVIAGFFVLHHLEIKGLAKMFSGFNRLLKHGGKIYFIEPNRLNILYFFQVTLMPDFEWRKEIGMYKLSPGFFRRILSEAGYEKIVTKNFGFFPPQVINRKPSLLHFESRLEQAPLIRDFLPFLTVTAEPQRDNL